MANLKNTTIDDNLKLPQGTTGERPASPQEGQIRYNTDTGTTEFYNGVNWRPLSDTHPEATGGTVVDTDIGGVPYRIHLFTETGTDTFTVTNPGEVEYLIVAGGGGGASREGTGGGGAGGLLQGTTLVTSQSYSITVGQGGIGGLGASNPYAGTQGSNTSALGFTAIGGGPGVQQSTPSPDGGSGGGGSRLGILGGTGVSGQGNNGGDGASNDAGGGGGGAGSPGENGVAGVKSGDGGQGISSLITGSVQFYAGGGGGAARQLSTTDFGKGGLGGGGRGGTREGNEGDTERDGVNGTPNTGGGGGAGNGSSNADRGGDGGSGIVIIRYPRNASTDTGADRTVVATQPLTLPESGRHFYNLTNTSQLDYYVLTIPFDLDSRNLVRTVDPTSLATTSSRIDNLAISNDGTVLYLVSRNITCLNLTRPFDPTSGVVSFNIANEYPDDEQTCFVFYDNGRKFYEHSMGNGEIVQYELSTPYDIRTKTETGRFDPGLEDNRGPGDPAFSPDGSRVVIGQRGGGFIKGGICNTPFDLTTFTEEKTFNTQNTDPSCCKWNGDGSILYIRHASPDMVDEYSTPNPYSLIGMSFVRQAMPDTAFAAGGIEFNYNF